ncbi:unnamed protein product [Adineta steineri]|uniref:Replication factor A protein 3 n=1 Tax=Adineta steineri TaxID=433720 RepID=A0A820C9C8_9BILA|nr:unnamed protein product [Adineta steineri]CAF0825010.1 unnamed protein product [Adineta steineri]CAF0938096.1 unnamed protein product [Adineta steineri]CAF0965335.1 unnamed protein product [Adineta steineri]CAF0967876.1 unnamed protein product [Adineta steineri]
MSHHYRINGSMIQQYSGKPVSIIGTVSKVHPSGNVIDLETSDKQHIVVRSSENVNVESGSIIEVLGNVDNRNQIECDMIVAFEPEQTANFDMDMYNQAVMLFQHYPQDYLVNL